MNEIFYCAHYDVIIFVQKPTVANIIVAHFVSHDAQIKILIDFIRGYFGINWDRCDAGQQGTKYTNTIHTDWSSSNLLS